MLPESIKEEEENSNIATINNESQNNKSEKEDNNSDMSSLVNQKIESQEIKIIKKPKLKGKGDFDRRSHLSHNIEGVIFEDINEDEEWEEKEKLHMHSAGNVNEYYKRAGYFEDGNDRDSMYIKNEILKKIHFNNNNNTINVNSNFNHEKNKVDNSNKNNSKNESYFDNVNFNDVDNIIKRNNSLDNSAAKQAEKIETAKSNIMQELLKHRNLAFVSEADKNKNKNKENEGLNFIDNNNNDSNRLRHFNSNPIPNSNLKASVNRNPDLKENYITFENESENENQTANESNINFKNNNNIHNENFFNLNNNENNQNEFLRFENLKADKENSGSNISFIIEKIKKERQKELLIQDVKEKIAKQSNDESFFYEVAKSIKMHKTADKEEILDEIIQSNLKKFIKKGEILESLISLSGLNNNNKKKSEKELIKSEDNLHSGKKQIKNNLIINDLNANNTNNNGKILNNSFKDFDNELKGVVEIMQNLNQNTKSEKLKNFINCKNSALNMLTKTRYSENKDLRIRIINGVAFLLIVLVFLAYHFYLRHM